VVSMGFKAMLPATSGKTDRGGYTLVELLMTIFIAAIAVNLILGTYGVVIRVWNRYNLTMEASDNAWINYTKIRTILSKTDGIKRNADSSWQLYRNAWPISVLRYENGILSLTDSIERWKSPVDSFALDIIDSANPPIIQCFLTSIKGKQKSSLAWRSVCYAEWNDTLLPRVPAY